MSWQERIVIDPAILTGKPVVRGTRLTDRAVAELIAVRHGQAIVPPVRFYPDPECLRWHRDNRFHAA